MRFIKAALAVGLANSFCAALDAPVYTLGSTAHVSGTGSQLASLSPSNARIYFAYRLGLSQYHSLSDVDNATIGLLNQEVGGRSPMFGDFDSEERSRRSLIIFSGVERPEDFFGASHKPVFTVVDPPSSLANIELVEDLLNQDRFRRGAQARCKSTGSQRSVDLAIHGGISGDDLLGTCESNDFDDVSWRALFNLETSEFSNHKGIEELHSIYTENSLTKSDGPTGIYHIATLQKIADKEGTRSNKYQETLANLRNALSSTQTETTVVLMPLTKTPGRRSTNKAPYGIYSKPSSQKNAKRSALSSSSNSVPATPFSSKRQNTSSKIPSTLIPVCYNSESTCTSATKGCSSHGACYKKYTEMVSKEEEGPECWACACVPTEIEQSGGGQKKIYWGGPACQKKDVSVPFFLFAGFGVAILIALSTAVGMLYGVGEVELPSVLGAGVAATGSRK